MGSDVGQSLDQRRASHAWDAIQRVKKNAESVGSSDARSHVRGGGDRVHDKKKAEPPGPSYLREAKQLPVRISAPGDQRAQRQEVIDVCRAKRDDLLLRELSRRRTSMLELARLRLRPTSMEVSVSADGVGLRPLLPLRREAAFIVAQWRRWP